MNVGARMIKLKTRCGGEMVHHNPMIDGLLLLLLWDCKIQSYRTRD